MTTLDYAGTMTCANCGEMSWEHCEECSACFGHAYYCSEEES